MAFSGICHSAHNDDIGRHANPGMFFRIHVQTSEYAPKVHTFLAEILTEAGLPEGVLNVLHIAPEDSPAVRC